MSMSKNEKELIKEHLDDCKQRLSPCTVKNHKSTLNALKNFLGDVDICYATKIDIRRFLNDLKIRKRSRSTIEGRLSCLKSFFKYINTYHEIETANLDDIDIMDYPKSRYEGCGTDALTRKEVRALIDAPNSIRNTLIISLLYYGGFRADEITKIKVDDVDRINRTIEIIGKGNKPRTVPYAKKLDRIIDLWLKKERRSYVNQDGPYFFPSKHGKKLTTSAVYRIVHRGAEKAGIQKIVGIRGNGSPIYKVHPHVLRHSYATHAVEDEIPLNHIQQYMGHSNITTTLRYTGQLGIFKSYYKKFKGI
jgi:site-specific recombinase XerD